MKFFDSVLEQRRFWGVATLVVFALHAFVVTQTVVDFPLFDDWAFFVPEVYGAWGTWDWFLSFHNEHRLLVTKGLFWMLQKWGMLDLRILQVLNIFLYGALLLLMYRVCRKEAPQARGLEAFFFFLVSAICSENIAWAIQSQYHVCLALFVGALLCLQSTKTSTRAFATPALLLAIFTLSGGVMLAASLALLYPFFARGRHELWTRVLGLSLPVGVGIFLWTRNYPEVAHHPSYFFPHTIKFWGHFSGMFSWLVGSDGLNAFPTIFSFFFFGVLAAFVIRSLYIREYSMTLGFVVGILALLASVSMGRAGQGTGQGKADRYAQLVVILLPFVYVVLKGSSRRWLSSWAPRVLWLACLWGYADNFNLWAAYESRAALVRGHLDCYRDPLKNRHSCPNWSGSTVDESLRFAREIDATFVRQIPE